MMTKKDYVKFAEILNRNLKVARQLNPVAETVVLAIAWNMSQEFMKDNPRFDKTRFYNAVNA